MKNQKADGLGEYKTKEVKFLCCVSVCPVSIKAAPEVQRALWKNARMFGGGGGGRNDRSTFGHTEGP